LDHYVEPIKIPENIRSDTLALIKETVVEMGGNIKAEQDNYIAVTFTSFLFRFIDDLEIRIDYKNRLIHIRSAARVGYSDLGVNRKRVDLLKRIFNKKVTFNKN